jgi:hypothetical protein
MKIGKLLEFFRNPKRGAKITDAKVNLGGGENITLNHFSAPGDDSFPLTTDYVAAMSVSRNRRAVAVGYADVVNEPLTVVGEKRIYSRSTSGEPIADIHLFNDGKVVLKNENGSLTLQPGGDFNINGVIINTEGHVLAPGGGQFLTTLKAAEKEIIEHTHPAGNPPGNTGPNNP